MAVKGLNRFTYRCIRDQHPQDVPVSAADNRATSCTSPSAWTRQHTVETWASGMLFRGFLVLHCLQVVCLLPLRAGKNMVTVSSDNKRTYNVLTDETCLD